MAFNLTTCTICLQACCQDDDYWSQLIGLKFDEFFCFIIIYGVPFFVGFVVVEQFHKIKYLLFQQNKIHDNNLNR